MYIAFSTSGKSGAKPIQPNSLKEIKFCQNHGALELFTVSRGHFKFMPAGLQAIYKPDPGFFQILGTVDRFIYWPLDRVPKRHLLSRLAFIGAYAAKTAAYLRDQGYPIPDSEAFLGTQVWPEETPVNAFDQILIAIQRFRKRKIAEDKFREGREIPFDDLMLLLAHYGIWQSLPESTKVWAREIVVKASMVDLVYQYKPEALTSSGVDIFDKALHTLASIINHSSSILQRCKFCGEKRTDVQGLLGFAVCVECLDAYFFRCQSCGKYRFVQSHILLHYDRICGDCRYTRPPTRTSRKTNEIRYQN